MLLQIGPEQGREVVTGRPEAGVVERRCPVLQVIDEQVPDLGPVKTQSRIVGKFGLVRQGKHPRAYSEYEPIENVGRNNQRDRLGLGGCRAALLCPGNDRRGDLGSHFQLAAVAIPRDLIRLRLSVGPETQEGLDPLEARSFVTSSVVDVAAY